MYHCVVYQSSEIANMPLMIFSPNNLLGSAGILCLTGGIENGRVSIPCRASSSSGNGPVNKNRSFTSGKPFPNGGSEIESPVPFEQQPINEFQSLKQSGYFSWALEDVWKYGVKLGAIGVSLSLLLGWPVLSLSVNPDQQFWKCGIGAFSVGIMGSTIAAVRLYLGWAYVGNRLFSATVEYEETGWYDGQIWIKPPEVLARDRLLGAYTVQPALNRMKVTLIGMALSLVTCLAIFFNIPNPVLSQIALPSSDGAVHSNAVPNSLPYREESAKLFEPDAFADEHDGKYLPDYCR